MKTGVKKEKYIGSLKRTIKQANFSQNGKEKDSNIWSKKENITTEKEETKKVECYVQLYNNRCKNLNERDDFTRKYTFIFLESSTKSLLYVVNVSQLRQI